MFDFFSHLTRLAVVGLGVAIFNFHPDFYSYEFRENELVIKISGLELKKSPAGEPTLSRLWLSG